MLAAPIGRMIMLLDNLLNIIKEFFADERREARLARRLTSFDQTVLDRVHENVLDRRSPDQIAVLAFEATLGEFRRQ